MLARSRCGRAGRREDERRGREGMLGALARCQPLACQRKAALLRRESNKPKKGLLAARRGGAPGQRLHHSALPCRVQPPTCPSCRPIGALPHSSHSFNLKPPPQQSSTTAQHRAQARAHPSCWVAVEPGHREREGGQHQRVVHIQVGWAALIRLFVHPHLQPEDEETGRKAGAAPAAASCAGQRSTEPQSFHGSPYRARAAAAGAGRLHAIYTQSVGRPLPPGPHLPPTPQPSPPNPPTHPRPSAFKCHPALHPSPHSTRPHPHPTSRWLRSSSFRAARISRSSGRRRKASASLSVSLSELPASSGSAVGSR